MLYEVITQDENGRAKLSGASQIKIEGCQYIIVESSFKGSQSYSCAITHKGNCSNPIHIYNQQ